jgi:UDP-N-acetylglucosamine 2-epimerase (non-hydrolysing)
LVRLLPKAQARWPGLRKRFDLQRFLLVTLHRPSNVDDVETLREIVSALAEIGREIPVLFPVHPRTHRRIIDFGMQASGEGLRLLEPLGYLDFLALQAHASLVLTDSGGIQEETTYLGVPCLTARPNTERPITITSGTNQLVESTYQALTAAIRSRLAAGTVSRTLPPLWDGKASERIVQQMRAIS